jgi:hypothetical protein
MLCREIITERKKKGKKKTKAKLGKYFYPGFAYYGGSGEADTGGGDGRIFTSQKNSQTIAYRLCYWQAWNRQ